MEIRYDSIEVALWRLCVNERLVMIIGCLYRRVEKTARVGSVKLIEVGELSMVLRGVTSQGE